MKKYLNYIIYFIIVFSTFFLDQLTKIIVENNINLGSSVSVLGNFFKFTYIHNDGAAFGILSGELLYLIIFSILVIFFILYQFVCYKDSKFICSSFAMLLGGLLGNLLDRLQYGYVRDFIDFTIFKYEAPIFNVSDIFIVISILMITIGVASYEGGVLVNGNNSEQRNDGEETRCSTSRTSRKKQK